MHSSYLPTVMTVHFHSCSRQQRLPSKGIDFITTTAVDPSNHRTELPSLDINNIPRHILRQLLPHKRRLLENSNIIPNALLQTGKEIRSSPISQLRMSINNNLLGDGTIIGDLRARVVGRAGFDNFVDFFVFEGEGTAIWLIIMIRICVEELDR